MTTHTPTRLRALFIAAAAGSATAAASAQCTQQWSGDLGIPAGMNGAVNALTTWDPDGPGPLEPQLVAGGAFGTASGVAVNKIARWDGVTWHPFAAGIGTSSAVAIYSLINFDPDGAGPQAAQLIAGGHFTVGGNYIIRWDPNSQTWLPLSSGMNNDVHAMTVWDPDGAAGPIPPQLIAGGEFTTAGGVSCLRVARWDGSNWHPLAAGMNGMVTALATHDPDGPGPAPELLIAGGAFTTAGGVSASRIALFDGTSWSAMGSGMNGTVRAFHHWDSGSGPQLIAAGDFTTAGGVSAARIARYDGVAWNPLGTGMNNSVRALTSWDPDGPGPTPPRLVAAGLFTTAGGDAIARLAYWDGTSWQGFGAGVNGSVYALTHLDPDGAGPAYPQLVVGGDFTLAAGNIANRTAMWVSSPEPVITTSPTDAVACAGVPTAFSVRAAAGAFPTYQWRRNGVNLSDGPTGTGSSLSGATSITLTITNASAADLGLYDVVVTSACGSATSAPARLTMCIANCDCSSAAPILNVNDFVCFQGLFASGSSLANCDGSTNAPILNVNDFICFQAAFASGCP